MPEQALEIFEQYRALLFGIAYRMLGSVMDAEDMVQDTFLRWQRQQISTEAIKSSKAFLITVITRLCLNQLNSARVKREEYLGPWLPEPLSTEQIVDPEKELTLAESLSMAFLVLLESLTPTERAIFLLREVFEYEYDEIARIVNKSEANCRQIFHRSRQQINLHRPRFEVSKLHQEQLLQQFVQVSTQGDLQGLITLLSEDITLWTDGGGKVVAALKPIQGSVNVARFILGSFRKLAPPQMVFKLTYLNGQLGLINYLDDQPHSSVIFNFVGNQIQQIYFVANPDKLKGLPPFLLEG